ncbi:hypothetical protein [Dyadobacter diqingensis]|nr:hypothetical protein [Dyadobacter diqingensis]
MMQTKSTISATTSSRLVLKKERIVTLSTNSYGQNGAPVTTMVTTSFL